MPLDQETISQQQKLLAHHRQRLALLFDQQAKLGVYTPPHIIIDIREAQGAIRSIKAALREGSVQVKDEPNDDALPAAVATSGGEPAATGPRVQSTINVTDNKGTVIGTQIINQARAATALHQLRAPVGDFVGRTDEIDQLVQALQKAAGNGVLAAISGVRGMGGIGKTELAYAAAQQLKDAFPDAQLLVELRGASANPLIPQAALQAAIYSFEREAKLPDDLSQLKAIYSSVLTGKRVLILADDAKDGTQVRPLLPPPGCALLVTSRNRFSLPGMAALNVGTLPPQEASKLLLETCPRIGEYASTLAKVCGYLPLALRVSASLLNNSSRSVARYLEQLETERLKHLSDPDTPDDPQASVDASLRLSYEALEAEAQQALCQLSVFATSFDRAAALAVVAVEGDGEALLDALQRRSLLEWDEKLQRFSLHDLVGVFASARLTGVAGAWLRYARHYAGVASYAQDNLYLKGEVKAGLALFDQERIHIDLGWGWACQQAGDQRADTLLLDYATATDYVGDLRYDKRRERIPQLEAQLAAARRLGRRGAEGAALGNLGSAYRRLGDARQAITFYEQELAIARELGNRRDEGNALGNLGIAYRFLGEAQRAITFYEQELAIARELGNRRGEGAALGNLGIAYRFLGDARQAITFLEQGLAIAREIGDRRGEGNALGNLGLAYAALGEAQRAITFYEQHLTVARELGNRRGEGNALGNLGLTYAALGEAQRAITFHEQRLEIVREMGDRHGEANASWNLGLALEQQGDLARAAELMQSCVGFLSEIGHPDAEEHAAYLDKLRQRLAGEDDGTVAGEGV